MPTGGYLLSDSAVLPQNLVCKVVNIGDWNMDSSAEVTLAQELAPLRLLTR